ncbi:transglutaminase-like cysteine peptidase [Enterovirga sp.]|uniref:transglutaminase-like cysteine peptidase n=1 Tax=Enterovirga sp. TaxID=2026350 RepID=UPI002D012C92|nr:transglutaminase-like cysteine peptidase [Enterovirga sp.]HMO29796.1 transglutaminase-like cysteine peptidase [Enterovirga sp.]
MKTMGADKVRGLARTWTLAAGAALLLFSAAAEAQTYASLPKTGSVGRLEVTGPARPVKAWSAFCERYTGECDVNTAEPASITLNAKLWRTLNAVNRKVNTTVKPTTDQDHWGVIDRWDLPTDGRGDCEDIQLLKRKILVEQYGVPKRALRMTVVIDEQGEGHAVLMVRTSEGELILDNKRDSILPWHQTGYIFVKREGQDSRSWVSLGDLSSPVTTANQ